MKFFFEYLKNYGRPNSFMINRLYGFTSVVENHSIDILNILFSFIQTPEQKQNKGRRRFYYTI